jgi:hypothetical protein
METSLQEPTLRLAYGDLQAVDPGAVRLIVLRKHNAEDLRSRCGRSMGTSPVRHIEKLPEHCLAQCAFRPAHPGKRTICAIARFGSCEWVSI